MMASPKEDDVTESRFKKTIRSLFPLLVIATVVAASVTLLADDDDDDEHEGHRVYRENQIREKATGEKTIRSDFLRGLAPVATNAKWKTECSSCHMLYHPGLLPERSWKKLMGGLDQHFGENASLDAKTRDEITKFLVENAADRSSARRSRKIDASIPAGETPIRITSTRYFIYKHDEVRDSVWKLPKVGSKANCVACHKDAESGYFNEHDVRIPGLKGFK